METPKDPQNPPSGVAPAGEPQNNAELETLRKELADTKKKLSDTASEREVLQSRLTEVSEPKGPSSEDQEIQRGIEDALTDAQIDPKKGAERLSSLLSKTRKKDQQEAINKALAQTQAAAKFQTEFNEFLTEVRTKNPKLSRYENIIARMAADKIQFQKKDYKSAINESVEEFSKLREADIKEIQPQTPSTAPAGASAEMAPSGRNPDVEKPIKSENPAPGDTGLTDADYVQQRKDLLAKRI